MRASLLYIQPWRKSPGARVPCYVADGPVADSFGQGGIEWEPALITRPIVSQQLCSVDLDGKVQAGTARFSISMNNIFAIADVKELDWQGAPVTIYSVDDFGWAERIVEFSGNVTSARPDGDTGRVQIEATTSISMIQVPLLTLSYSGGGGINGDAGLRGVYRPAGFGVKEYVEPVWFDETYNIGQLDGYGNLVSIQKVMEGANDYGASVADYASYTLLRAAIIAKTIPPGRYGTCLADGLIGFGAKPVGVIGVNCTFGYGLPGSFMQRIATFHAGIAIGLIDTAAFTSLTTQVQAVVGGTPTIGLWFNDQQQVQDLLEKMARTCNATPLVTAQGVLTVSRGVASAAVATLNRNGSTDPRVLNWRIADSRAPVYQLAARTARPARVLTRAEVFGEDDFVDMGPWNALTGYRYWNTVYGPDGAEWLYINAVPQVGPALPTAAYPPAAKVTTANWQQLTYPAPTTGSQIGVADNATADISLVSIGSQVATIAGNSISRAAGSGDFNACVRGTPLQGTHYAEVDIVAGANFTIVSLDDDATSTAQAAMLLHFYYRASDGAWNVNYQGASVASGTTTAGLTGKARLSYDGIRYRVFINAAKMGGDIAASASNLILWPKWHAFNGPSIVYTGIAAGPYTSNVWPDIDGPNRPADNATADLKLTSIGSTSVTIVGNTIIRATGTADYQATVRGEPIAYSVYAEMDIPASNTFCIIGLDTSATGVAATTAWRFYLSYNYSTGALSVIRAGVSVLSTNIGSVTGKIQIAYDGVKYRVFVGGVERALTGSAAETAGLSLWPKWSSYTSGVVLTGLLAAAYTNNDFGTIGGPTRPSDNATTDITLTSIGSSALTIVGNSVTRTSGSGDRNATVRGNPITGPQFVEIDIYQGADYTIFVIDDDATTFNSPTSLYEFFYNYGTGAWNISSNGVSVGSGTTTAGLIGKLRITYDGIRFRFWINQTQMGTDQAASSTSLVLWPKWHAFGLGNVYTGLRAGVFTANYWSDIAGTGRPSDNAGTSGVLTTIGSYTVLTGNSIYKTGGTHGAFEGGVVGQALYGTAFVTSSIYSPVAGGGYQTHLALDDDATSFAFTTMNYELTIATFVGFTWSLNVNNVTVASGSGSGQTLNSRASLVYDGVNVYAIVDGVILGQTPAAAGQKLWPKVLDFYNTAATGSAPGPIKDILYGPWSENAWLRIGGTGKPADNATADIVLTGIGTAANVIVGNAYRKTNSGSAHTGGAAITSPIAGPQFVEADIIAGNVNNQVALDDTATDYQSGTNILVYANYNPSTGGYSWGSNGSITTSGTTASLTGKIRIEYDGVYYRLYIGGNLVGVPIAATAPDLKLWAKWPVYDANVQFTGAAAGAIASNAGAGVTFALLGNAGELEVRGSRVTKLAGNGTWNAKAYALEAMPNTGIWQFRLPDNAAAGAYGIYGITETPTAYSAGSSYGGLIGVYQQSTTGVAGWDNAGYLTGFAAGVANAATDVWTIQYDGNTIWIFQTSAGTTTLRGSKVVGPGKKYSFAACPYIVGSFISDILQSTGPERYLDNINDGSTYGRTNLTELTGGLLRLTQAGGGRRLGDTRNMPNIAALNLGYKWTGAITYTSASGTPATGTISVAAGSTTSGLTINYNAMSVGVTGTNGTSTQFYLYVNDPTNAGGAQTLIATTTALTIYSGSGYVYVGECLVAFPSSGSGGGGGGGGGGVCVGADEWVETFDRGFLPAREIRTGDVVRVLTEDRDGVAWETVTANKLGWDNSWLITSESGVEVLVSWSTPITLRDGSLIAVSDIDGQELPIFIDELAWEACWARFVGMNQVAKIECNQKTYAAGRIAGRSIMTHNPKP